MSSLHDTIGRDLTRTDGDLPQGNACVFVNCHPNSVDQRRVQDLWYRAVDVAAKKDALPVQRPSGRVFEEEDMGERRGRPDNPAIELRYLCRNLCLGIFRDSAEHGVA